MTYVPANTDWLAHCRYGISAHWTARTVPRQGAPKDYAKAVAQFDVPGFVADVVASGADYVIFTVAHALQYIPAPHPVVEGLLHGRTCARDLLGELAVALTAQGKHLILYYNHSCNSADDPPWEQAVGYHAYDKERLAHNLLAIVTWMGERYGKLLSAWWFDSCYSLDPRGPHSSVTIDLRGWQFPWERFTAAAKAGHPARLVTYNAGVGVTYLYTTHQDYWAGELVDLLTPAPARTLPSGLQWHGWTCLDDRAWVQASENQPVPPPLYSDAELLRFVAACHAHAAPVCFNAAIYQDGRFSPLAVQALARLGAALGPR